MKELTQRARDNLAAGATSGAGTLVCAACNGPKSERRVNSSQCTTCQQKVRPPVTTALRVTLDAATMADLAADAETHDESPAALVSRLLTTRYNRRRAAAQFPETQG